MARGLQPLARVRDCGSAAGSMVMLGTAKSGSHIAGITTCGSVHSCPVCSPVIRQSRAADLATAIDRWISEGGSVFFVTLTVQHVVGQSLESSIDALSKSWRKLASGRARREIDGELGTLGNVRALDLTYGANGWHPHYHCVWFVRGGTTVAQVRASIVSRWIRATGTVGRQAVEMANDVQRVWAGQGQAFSLAMYAMKAGLELMRVDLKRAGKGSSPWELLDDAIQGDRQAAALWIEYSSTTAGRRSAVWSRGLRAWFGQAEKSDEELAVGVLEDFVPVAAVAARQWNRQRRRHPDMEAAILHALEHGGLFLVAELYGLDLLDPGVT